MGKSDLRCAACEIFGGITIPVGTNERERTRAAELARSLTKMIAEETGATEEAAPGDRVLLQPCVPRIMLDRIRETKGRPCPRPAERMDDVTAVAYEGLWLTLSDHTKALFASWLTWNVHARERASVVRRIARALSDGGVVDELKGKMEPALPE